MNLARSATLSCSPAISPLFIFGFLLAPATILSATAAPIATASASASTLSFDVTVRARGAGQLAAAQQTIQAKVLLRGDAARVESSSGGTPSVVLFSPPYVYRLLPSAKAGVRWKIPTRQLSRQPSNYANFDPQQLLRDPAKIKGFLLQGGAKVVGKGVLSGAAVDIYEAKNFGARGQNAKVWLRHSDSLPVRLEASGSALQVVASWRNYTRPKLSGTLFGSPPGYKVRDLPGPPPFSAL